MTILPLPLTNHTNEQTTGQAGLVDTLLTCDTRRAQRALIAAHASEWTPETVAILKSHCDRLIGVQPRRAVHLARLAHLAAQATGSDSALALADHTLAQACHALGHFALAVALYRRASAQFDRAGDAAQAEGSRAIMVDALMQLGCHERALVVATETRVILESLGDRRRVALLDANLGNGLLLLGRPRDARAAYARAAEAFKQLDDPVALAKVEVGYGNALLALQDPHAAQQAFDAATDTFERLHLTALAAQSRYNLAYVQFRMGHYARAFEGLERARRVFATLDDRQYLVLCALDEAELLLTFGRSSEGVLLLERALAGLQRLGRQHEVLRARLLLARGLLKLGRLGAAEAALDGAHLAGDETNSHQRVALLLLHAEILLRRAQDGAALEQCMAAMKMLGQAPAPNLLAEVYLLQAHILHRLGRTGASAAAGRALHAARDARTPWLIWQAHHLKGMVRDARGDRYGAAQRYRRAVQAIERLRRTLPTAELRASFHGDAQQLYASLVRNALSRREPAEAFVYVEASRSRALADLLQRETPPALAGEAGDEVLVAEIERLRDELTWLHARLFDDMPDAPQPGTPDWDDSRRSLQRHESALLRATRRLQRGSMQQEASGVPSQTLDQIRAALPAATTLLDYFVAGEDIVACAVGRDSLEVRTLPDGVARLAVLLRRWRLYLGKFAYGGTFTQQHAALLAGTARAILGHLHDLLIAPLLDVLGSADLIVVPHGALHAVPFHALRAGQRYLIEERGVSYAPSATILCSCLERERRDGDIVVVGVPDGHAPAIAQEVAAVANLYKDSIVLSGTEATAAAFQHHAGNAAILHIAAHALFRPDNPLFSAFRLADRWFTLQDLHQLRMCADLVTLSGCATGAVGSIDNEGLIGLIRGFLHAGCATIVASLWPIDDAASTALMEAFYRLLRRLGSPREAMRQAQIAALRAGAQPYEWAPFCVVGRP